ncbi:MAG: AP2 domain-containing protein [Caldisericia bacterium]|nr:AP2 domain-containing protein [Caldisericia bacterium]
MSNIKDLTNQRFGRLTAVKRTDKKHSSSFLWLCKCDCGNEILVSTYFLTHGIRKSCGCLLGYDLKGKKFGRLTAISPTDKRKHNCVVWECLCDCGKTCNVRSDMLLSGDTKSCGCLHLETATKQAASGIWESNIEDGTNIKLIQSQKLYRNNTSGCKGVYWHRGTGMWVARIQFKGKTYSLGYRSDKNEAIKLRKEAELKYFGEYLNKRGEGIMATDTRFQVRDTQEELEKLDKAIRKLGYKDRADWYRDCKRQVIRQAESSK